MSDAVVSAEELPPQVFEVPSDADSVENIGGPILGMDFFGRVVQLPVVDQTLNIVTNLYGKVKDSNRPMTWTLNTAKSTLDHAVDSLPASQCFVESIGKVDGFLCSSLDYLEVNVPTVKLPPQEILRNGKQYMYETWLWVRELGAAKTSDVENCIRSACALAVPSHFQKATGTDKSCSTVSMTDSSESSSSKPDITVNTTIAEVVAAIDKLELLKKSMELDMKRQETPEMLKEAEHEDPNALMQAGNKLLEAGKNLLNVKSK